MRQVKVFLAVGDGSGWAIDDDIAMTRRSLAQVANVVEVADINDCDVVHCPWTLGLSCYDDSSLRGKRIICHLENDISWLLEQSFVPALRERVGLWFAISKKSRQDLDACSIANAYVPYTIDTKVFSRDAFSQQEIDIFRNQWRVPEDRFLIGNFMRDSLGADLTRPKEQKAPELFLEIAKELNGRGVPVHVVLAGPRRHWLRGRLQENGIPYTYIGRVVEQDDNDINILDRSEIAKIYQILDLYIVTSRWEGGPRSVLEAAASRCHIISTPVGLAMDVLDESNIFSTVDEAVSAAEKIWRGRDNDAALERQYGRIRDQHVPESNVPRLEEIYGNWKAIPAYTGSAKCVGNLAESTLRSGRLLSRARAKVGRILKLPDRPGRGLKISIWHQFKKPPYGGANQFMMALKKELEALGVRVSTNKLARSVDVHLCNSIWFDVDRFLKCADKYPVRMLHRIDGPTAVYRGSDRSVDNRIFEINACLATRTIVQSDWSYRKLLQEGYAPRCPVKIRNAVDPDVFNSNGRVAYRNDRKLRLIVTSWSDNPRKGGPVYKWLEDHLDWSRYEFTYVGRTQEEFGRAKLVPPVSSRELGRILRQHDVYITASQDETCSNAVLEAMACGLPVLYLDQGGHREFVGLGGLPFTGNEELLARLEMLADNYASFQNLVYVRSINEIARDYISVIRSVMDGAH